MPFVYESYSDMVTVRRHIRFSRLRRLIRDADVFLRSRSRVCTIPNTVILPIKTVVRGTTIYRHIRRFFDCVVSRKHIILGWPTILLPGIRAVVVLESKCRKRRQFLTKTDGSITIGFKKCIFFGIYVHVRANVEPSRIYGIS